MESTNLNSVTTHINDPKQFRTINDRNKWTPWTFIFLSNFEASDFLKHLEYLTFLQELDQATLPYSWSSGMGKARNNQL